MPAETFHEAVKRSDDIWASIDKSASSHRVLTGDRPTGALHLGHKFGSLENRVRIQHLGIETFIVIADYQVLTDRLDTSSIESNVREIVLDYLSVGLDPWNGRTFIFVHSYVPELHQLVLPFSMLVSLQELSRNPTIKEEIRAAKLQQTSIGMLTYPISQAADILFCKATLVPVGKDQLPHVETARKIARRCNELLCFGTVVFPEPSALLSEVPLLLGLDGSQKMSKSRRNAIFLTTPPEEIRSLIRTAKTDSLGSIDYAPENRPEISNLIRLMSLCTGEAIPQIVQQWANKNYSLFKSALAEAIIEHLRPIQSRRLEFARTPSVVREILDKGIAEARRRAIETLDELRHAMKGELPS